MADRTAAALALLLVVAGCRAPDASTEAPAVTEPRSLMARVAAGGGSAGDEQAVTVGDSRRLAYWTEPGGLLRIPLEAVADAGGLAFSVGRPPPQPEAGEGAEGTAEAPATAIVEVESAAGRRELLRRSVDAGSWLELSTEVPPSSDVDGGAAGHVVLRSEGLPLAWAGLRRAGSGAVGPGAPPNLILVVLDTVRADHLGAYGYHRDTSPRLDSLARSSVLFEHSVSASTWTLPSAASLMTGLAPDQHGLRRTRDRLTRDVTTVAERLRDAGYWNVAFTDGGFFSPTWGLAQGFERYETTAGAAWAPKDAAVIARRVIDWLRTDPPEPFFLLVHTYEAHQPYVNREGFADPFLDPAYRGPLQDRARLFTREGKATFEGEELQRVIDLYDGGIRRADHYLGTILDALEERRLLERSTLLVTSDHGEELGEHGGLEHTDGKVFDENIRVPLLLRPPGGVAEGRVREPVTGLDVVPALLEQARLWPPPAGPLLLGRPLPLGNGATSPRAWISHGLPSNGPPADRIRFELASDEDTVAIVDRLAPAVALYDRGADPDLLAPLGPDVAAERLAAPQWRRLPLTLEWLAAPGSAIVALDSGAERVALRGGDGADALLSRRQAFPLGARRVRATAAGRSRPVPIELDPQRFSILGLEGAALPGTLRVAGGTGDARRELDLGPPRSWNPLVDPLPAWGEALATARRSAPLEAEVDAAQRRQLEALGYVP